MAAWNTSTVVAAGIGLVFGLCGGVAGALIVGVQPSAPVPSASFTSTATPPQDPALRDVLTDLTREVRTLHESLTTRLAEPTRSPALASAMPDVDRLVAALEAFAKNANASPATASTSGRNAPALILPTRPRDERLLRELVQTEYVVRSRQYRFLTYQQVLDRFGRPDEVQSDGSWYYDLSESGELNFKFFDGMLVNIE